MALIMLAGPVSNFLLAWSAVGARIMVIDHAAYSATNQDTGLSAVTAVPLSIGLGPFQSDLQSRRWTGPRCCSRCCRTGRHDAGMSASEYSCCGLVR
ncbi:MAG: hypothetical protein ACLU38_09080 [Dysosmobacter sp.]